MHRPREVPWVCDMAFNAKFSALGVSTIFSYQLNFTYLGCACQECFYKLKYLLTVRSKQILISFFHLQETVPRYEWINSEADGETLHSCRAVKFLGNLSWEEGFSWGTQLVHGDRCSRTRPAMKHKEDNRTSGEAFLQEKGGVLKQRKGKSHFLQLCNPKSLLMGVCNWLTARVGCLSVTATLTLMHLIWTIQLLWKLWALYTKGLEKSLMQEICHLPIHKPSPH